MLTLCLPAAGIQEEEAVAIGGGGRDGGKKRPTSQLYINGCCSDTSILFHCYGPLSNNRDTLWC
jgi:hypothetical protein